MFVLDRAVDLTAATSGITRVLKFSTELHTAVNNNYSNVQRGLISLVVVSIIQHLVSGTHSPGWYCN